MPTQSVLLVDDDPDIRTIGRLSLANVGGLTVHLAASGAEALALLASLRPDLILLDVMMPDLDGPATLRALKDDPALADIPVVFMTAKAHPREVERYLALGARAVIAKPFDPLTLAERVRAQMG